jgi:hypothetical protein
MTSRRVALVVAALAVTALATGTFGFTGVDAERGLSVAVADDDEAFLGLEPGPLDHCGEQRLVTVTNRFEAAVTVDVSVVGTSDVRVGAVGTPDGAVGPGESAHVSVRLQPDEETATDGGDGTVTVRIHAAGEGVESAMTRTYAVQCAPSSPGGSTGTSTNGSTNG